MNLWKQGKGGVESHTFPLLSLSAFCLCLSVCLFVSISLSLSLSLLHSVCLYLPLFHFLLYPFSLFYPSYYICICCFNACLYVFMYVHPYICSYVCPFLCLSIHLSVCLSVCLACIEVDVAGHRLVFMKGVNQGKALLSTSTYGHCHRWRPDKWTLPTFGHESQTLVEVVILSENDSHF